MHLTQDTTPAPCGSNPTSLTRQARLLPASGNDRHKPRRAVWPRGSISVLYQALAFARAEVVAPNWAFWSSASEALPADSAAGKLSAMVVAPALVDWLLDSDPALRWQVERDLAGAP